jgi:predicted ATPase
MPVLCGLWNYFLTRADFEQVQSLAGELSALIDRSEAGECLLPAHNALGQTHLFMGAPALALGHVDAGPARCDLRPGHHSVSQYGEDPVLVCHMYAALTDWLLGLPGRAQQRIDAGLRRADELAQPFGMAQILWAGLIVALGRGDLAGLVPQARRLIELCEREDLGVWLAGGRILSGWAMADQGRPAAGIVSIQQGLEAWEATGSALIRPYYLALLAQAEARRGRFEAGLGVVSEALETAERTGERWYEAELHRLQATLRVQLDGTETAEADAGLQRALAVARGQQARALELRAAISLARLWANQGRKRDARELLAGVHGAFTEGFETADLRQARALLEALAQDGGGPSG